MTKSQPPLTRLKLLSVFDKYGRRPAPSFRDDAVDDIISLIDQHEDWLIGEDEEIPTTFTPRGAIFPIAQNDLRAEQRQRKLTNQPVSHALQDSTLQLKEEDD